MTGYFFPSLCNIFNICRAMARPLAVLLPALLLATGLAAQSLPSGGTITEPNRGGDRWRVHSFATGSRAGGSYTLTVPGSSPVTSMDYLLVGGGGAGGALQRIVTGPSSGRATGAGGGGGGVVSGGFTPATGSYAVLVGAGGLRATTIDADGQKGGVSSLTGAGVARQAQGGGTPSETSSRRNGASGAGG